MSKHAEFVTNMDKMMVRWDKEVAALAHRAGNGASEAGEAYQDGVKELRACRDDAQKAFQEIRFAGEQEGQRLKASASPTTTATSATAASAARGGWWRRLASREVFQTWPRIRADAAARATASAA